MFLFAASRLGRRPKRLKDSSGEPKREINVPIAPYPSPAELYKLRMAELQRLLQQNGTFKSELMEAFLSAAQVSFREHQRNNNSNDNQQKNKKNSQHKPGASESGCTPSNMSSPLFNNSGKLPDIIDQNIQNKNLSIDSKSGIIQDLDNFRIGTDSNNSSADDNLTLSPDITTTTNEYTQRSDIKIEPELDNRGYAPMTDNSNSSIMSGMPPMPDAASPFMMPQLSPDMMMPDMMMPDMMEMMGDGSMMSGMMSSMMPLPGMINYFKYSLESHKH